MTNKNLRGFSAGIIISTGILAGVYYSMDSDSNPTFTDESVDQYLSEKGELAISETEYTSLKAAQTASAAPKTPETPEPAKEEKVVEMNLNITQGMSTGEVCDLLQQGKIIKDSKAFLKYLRSHNLEGAVRAESHQVNSSMNFDEIAKEITSS